MKKGDPIPLDDPFLDKRVKLLPCQREMVLWWYFVKGEGLRAIGRRFKVHRRTIEFVLFPEKLEACRKSGSVYYDKKNNTDAMRRHREYKNQLLNL